MVDVWLEGIEVAPLTCLVDSGALGTRFSAELAGVAGIDLAGAPKETLAVGGQTAIVGSTVRVGLRVSRDGLSHEWDAPVSFCDPWPFGFGLLGVEGFLQNFRVTISGYEEWVECQPES